MQWTVKELTKELALRPRTAHRWVDELKTQRLLVGSSWAGGVGLMLVWALHLTKTFGLSIVQSMGLVYWSVANGLPLPAYPDGYGPELLAERGEPHEATEAAPSSSEGVGLLEVRLAQFEAKFMEMLEQIAKQQERIEQTQASQAESLAHLEQQIDTLSTHLEETGRALVIRHLGAIADRLETCEKQNAQNAAAILRTAKITRQNEEDIGKFVAAVKKR